jgi:hypothetical protein
MKISIYLYVATVVVLLIFQQCNSQGNHKEINPLMRPQIDSLLTAFSEGINKEDSIGVFVILKNVDANTLKIYLVAKKVLKSDFKVIGTPVTSDNRNDTHFYFYSGMEKLLMPDISFWNNHPEIFNDSLKQVGGLYETPIVKKALYIFEGNKIIKSQIFDDLIFVDNPVDSIKFH